MILHKLSFSLTFLAVQHIRMINEELLRENGNLKDLVVQTSAGLEREKSNQEKLVHHNKLINNDNATLQSRIEELLSVIDRQRRELASAYESSQRMAFEQSVAWREVQKRAHLKHFIIIVSICLHPLLRLSTTSANEKSMAAHSQSIPCIIELVFGFEGRQRGTHRCTFFGFLSVDGKCLQLLVITSKRRGCNSLRTYFGAMTRQR